MNSKQCINLKKEYNDCDFIIIPLPSINFNWKTKISSIVEIMPKIKEAFEINFRENVIKNIIMENKTIELNFNEEKAIFTNSYEPYINLSLLNINKINKNNEEIFEEGIFLNDFSTLIKLNIDNQLDLKNYFILTDLDSIKIRLIRDYEIKIENEKLKKVFKLPKYNFKQFKNILLMEINQLFKSNNLNIEDQTKINDYFIKIQKNNYFMKIISIFFNEKLFNNIIKEILKCKEIEFKLIKHYFISLFISFEYFGEKSIHFLKHNNYIKNDETITVYKIFWINNEKYTKWINLNNNSLNYCNEFFITTLDLKSLLNFQLNEPNQLLFKKLILEIKIKTDRKFYDFLYLSKKINNKFDDKEVVIRYGTILQIYSIKEQLYKNNQLITFVYAKVQSVGSGYQGIFQYMTENNNLNYLNLSYSQLEKKILYNEFMLKDLNEMLIKNNGLKILQLNQNNLGSSYNDNSLQSVLLYKSIQLNKSLEIIDFSNNSFKILCISTIIMKEFCKAIRKNNILSEINISLCNLGLSFHKNPNFLKKLCKAIKMNTNIKYIDLSYNRLGSFIDSSPKILKEIFEAIKYNQNFRYINLSGNDLSILVIYQHIVKELCELIKYNKNLQVIDLSNNGFLRVNWKFDSNKFLENFNDLILHNDKCLKF